MDKWLHPSQQWSIITHPCRSCIYTDACNSMTVPTDVRALDGAEPSADHYSAVIMGSVVSQITSLTIVYSTVYSDADQRKHQSSASLAFVREIHRGPVNSPHKWPVTWKMFPFEDVIMRNDGNTAKHMLDMSFLKITTILFWCIRAGDSFQSGRQDVAKSRGTLMVNVRKATQTKTKSRVWIIGYDSPWECSEIKDNCIRA